MARSHSRPVLSSSPSSCAVPLDRLSLILTRNEPLGISRSWRILPVNRLLVAVVTLFSGCVGLAPETGSWSGSGAGSSFSTDLGTVHRGIANLSQDNKPYLILLTAGGEPTKVNGGRTGSGQIKAVDGSEIIWTCDTRDGVTGALVIGGRRYRLEDGGIVLVDMRGKKLVVEQAIVDMSQLQVDNLEIRLKSLAESDKRIARFLQACDKPQY
jgi:hypothetical protein